MGKRKTIQVNDIVLHKELKKMSVDTGLSLGELAENGIRMLLLEMKGCNNLSKDEVVALDMEVISE